MTMVHFLTLKREMENLRRQAEKTLNLIHDTDDVIYPCGFGGSGDVELLFVYEELSYEIDSIIDTIAYYHSPVVELSELHVNDSGRFETDGGHVYERGSRIEFLYGGAWRRCTVETDMDTGRYYISDFENLDMNGLMVRVRSAG